MGQPDRELPDLWLHTGLRPVRLGPLDRRAARGGEEVPDREEEERPQHVVVADRLRQRRRERQRLDRLRVGRLVHRREEGEARRGLRRAEGRQALVELRLRARKGHEELPPRARVRRPVGQPAVGRVDRPQLRVRARQHRGRHVHDRPGARRGRSTSTTRPRSRSRRLTSSATSPSGASSRRRGTRSRRRDRSPARCRRTPTSSTPAPPRRRRRRDGCGHPGSDRPTGRLAGPVLPRAGRDRGRLLRGRAVVLPR